MPQGRDKITLEDRRGRGGGHSVGPMTRTERITTITTWLLIAGSLAWLVKLVVIAATDAHVNDVPAVGVFYLLGVALLVLGSPAVGLTLARHARVVVRVAMAILSPALVVASFALVDGLAKPALEGSGPAWIHEEWGILGTAVLWLAVGARLARDNSLKGSGPVTQP